VPISSRRRAMLAALSSLAVAGAAPGLAQAANPTPCNGVPLIEDTVGDAIVKPLGGFGVSSRSHEGPENTDIENAWLSWDKGADGKKALNANIQLANVDMTVPSPADSQGGLAYYVFWQDGDTVRFLRAQNQTGNGFTFNVGHIQQIGANGTDLFSAYATDSAVPGKLFEGKHGVVQMTFPDVKAGQTLAGVETFVDGFNGGPDDLSGLNNHFDSAPDEADPSAPNGFDYKVADCVKTKKRAARR
jgi:hypothetical protein